MREIRKILLIFLLLLTTVLSFAFKIDELEFGKEIRVGEKGKKIFTLTNNNIEPIIYKLSIEGRENIKVYPKLLNIEYSQNKQFKVEVEAEKIKGKYDYFLVIKEVKKGNQEKGIDINKIIKIKQSYIVK